MFGMVLNQVFDMETDMVFGMVLNQVFDMETDMVFGMVLNQVFDEEFHMVFFLEFLVDGYIGPSLTRWVSS